MSTISSCLFLECCKCVLQVFRGVHWSDDVLNHENVGFWHYLQPAYNVMGFISCAGTNFLLRSAPFASAGEGFCMHSVQVCVSL